jgi:hypothetical protein
MARHHRVAVLLAALLSFAGLGSLTSPRAAASVNPGYDRTAAVHWALENAQDSQGASGLCTWFVSNALWAGGLPRAQNWQQGTYDATNVPGLVSYLEAHYSVTWTDITRDLTTNAVPQAELGDIIVYSWHGNGTLDHMAFVVGFAPGDYPEVSEWGQFNFIPDVWDYLFNPRSPYVERGWTYSGVNHAWLQTIYPGMKAYLLHINGGYFTPTF